MTALQRRDLVVPSYDPRGESRLMPTTAARCEEPSAGVAGFGSIKGRHLWGLSPVLNMSDRHVKTVSPIQVKGLRQTKRQIYQQPSSSVQFGQAKLEGLRGITRA